MYKKALLITPIYGLIVLYIIAQHSLSQAIVRGNIANAQASTAATQVIDEARKKPRDYSGRPVSLEIPRLGMQLSIADGLYDIPSKSWTLSRDKAHFAKQTQPLNNKEGLTLIYGHNTPQVFRKTRELLYHDLLEIKTDNGLVFSYAYVDDLIVKPTDTSIFNYTGKPRVSLLACTGTWNENRRIMNFELTSVRKAG